MKQLILLAGPNGAGKTTIFNSLPVFSNFKYLNIDNIASTIDDSFSLSAYKKAYKIFCSKLDFCLTNSENFVRETTLCGRSIFNFVSRAKCDGYFVSLIFVYVEDVDICISRIKHRVNMGGHNVDADSVKRRYKNSIVNVTNNFELFDDVVFYDNTFEAKIVAKYNNGDLIFQDEILPDWFKNIFSI